MEGWEANGLVLVTAMTSILKAKVEAAAAVMMAAAAVERLEGVAVEEEGKVKDERGERGDVDDDLEIRHRLTCHMTHTLKGRIHYYCQGNSHSRVALQSELRYM